MASLKQFAVSEESIEILKLGKIEGKIYFLPEVTLERLQYEAVNKVLVALGAKWDKRAKGHVFDYDITEELKSVIETGTVTDWKKATDFFYTPEAVALEMLGLVPRPCAESFVALEPSAGQGHILDALCDSFPNATIKCIEINPMHCDRLKQKGYAPTQGDFLNIEPFPVDVVIMNPPFTYEMEHIRHAYDFLAKGGQLITVASGNVLGKSTRKGKEFNEWFNSVDGCEYGLPQNSFKESGTSVSTQLLVLEKDG